MDAKHQERGKGSRVALALNPGRGSGQQKADGSPQGKGSEPQGTGPFEVLGSNFWQSPSVSRDMQTFMPHDSYWESAIVLDPARRRNQRNEAKVILKTLLGLYPLTKKGRPGGWPYHPATKMWKGYEYSLCDYGIAICKACIDGGWVEGDLTEFFEELKATLEPTGTPLWMGKFSFHESHRSNLLRKDPEWYRRFWPGVPDDLPYVWPV